MLSALLLLVPLACSGEAGPQALPSLPPLQTLTAPTAEACPATVQDLAAQYPAQVDLEDARLLGTGLIVVQKGARRIQRFSAGQQVADGCWRVGLGFAPEEHKQVEGDGKTPEGWYRTSDKPWSQWYAAIAIHYPSAADALAGEADGRISAATRRSVEAALRRGENSPQGTALGGEILIHGGGSLVDWTLGCIAMNNEDIDALRATLPAEKTTDVLILP